MTAKFEMVPLDGLLLSNQHGTQRVEGVNAREVERMVKNWDMNSVGTITVVVREEGSRFVPDGAHRVTAARELGLAELPGIVHRGLTREEEAAMFGGLNHFKVPSPISKFLARAAAGDEVAVDIKRIVESRRFKIVQNGDNGSLSAIAAVERIYRNGAGTLPDGTHADVLEWVLDATVAAWEHDRDSTHGAILAGLAQLVGRFGKDVDVKRLVAEMSQTRPPVVLGKAKLSREIAGGTMPAHVAKVLVGMHNAKKRTNKLPEWVWTR